MRRKIATRVAGLALVVGVLVGVPALPAAAAAGKDILKSFTDVNGSSWPVRYGTYDFGSGNGFGYQKACYKHNICNIDSIGFAIKSPLGPRLAKNGLSYFFTGYAERYIKQNGRYYHTDEIKVQTQVQGYMASKWGIALNGTVGVMTAYCTPGIPVCPNWVDRALAGGGRTTTIAPQSFAEGAAPTGTTVSGDEAYSAGFVPYGQTKLPTKTPNSTSDEPDFDDGE